MAKRIKDTESNSPRARALIKRGGDYGYIAPGTKMPAGTGAPKPRVKRTPRPVKPKVKKSPRY